MELNKKTLLLSLIFILTLSAGCAYFNTFFNAKYYYKKGYYETRHNRTGNVTSAEESNYNRSIEKCLKLLELYPKSKYVDDALLLLGKSYFHKQEYRQAERKLRELETAYPDGELALETQLWLARTLMALEQFEESEARFKALLNKDISKTERANIQFALGQFHERREEFELAIRAYNEAIRLGLEEDHADALFAVATNYDTLGIYDRAAEYYNRVVESNPSMEMLFDADLKYAIMQTKLADYDGAIRLFQGLLGDERNRKAIPRLELEIAEALYLKGDKENAVLAFHDITQNHPRTMQSAESYYRLGRIYEHTAEYDRAFEQYEKVRQENSRSVYADSADLMKRDIQRFIALNQVIEMADAGTRGELRIEGEEVEEDSLTVDLVYAMVDSAATDSLRNKLLFRMAGKVFVDSVSRAFSQQRDAAATLRQRSVGRERRDPTTMDWNEWIRDGFVPNEVDLVETLMELRERADKLEFELAENPELKSFNVEEVNVNLFYLAELYLFRFELPDTASAIYQRIIDEFPESPLAPRAMYNLAYLYETEYDDLDKSTALYARLVDSFPNTPFGLDAREKLGQSAENASSNNIADRFLEAERQLFQDSDPTAAFTTYASIWETYPETDEGTRALYGMAWVAETYLDSLQMAFMLYDSLVHRFPESPYAKRVNKKVEAFRAELAARETASSAEAMTVVPPDSAAVQPDSVQTMPVDTTRIEKGNPQDRS